MYIQQMIYRNGGSYTIQGATIEECLSKTAKASARLQNELFGITMPYHALDSRKPGEYVNASIPLAWRAALGEKFCGLYGSEVEPAKDTSLTFEKQEKQQQDEAWRHFISLAAPKLMTIANNNKSLIQDTKTQNETVQLIYSASALSFFSATMVVIAYLTGNQPLNMLCQLMIGCSLALYIAAFASAARRP